MLEMKEGQWCHVEIPTGDAKKAQRFYGEVFGWKFQEIPQMQYTLYETGNNGGKQIKEKTEVPGAGWFSLVSDPDGNVIGLWKSASKK